MHRSSLAGRITVALVSAALAVTALGAPAQGETRRFHDPNESGTINDTSGVVVRHTLGAHGPHGSAGRLVVKVQAGNVLFTDFFDLWIDVPGQTRNFHARIRPQTEFGPVRAVTGFTRAGPVACRRWEAGAVSSRHTVVVFSIPRPCLGDPARVRVATRSTYVYNQGTQRDWVPAVRAFTPWVSAS